jgi:anti-sigma regulatory factor (Ser/Thr protein kinase)
MEESLPLASDVGSPRRARQFVQRTLADRAVPSRPDVMLMVSELVTNAVVHAVEPIEVAVDVNDESIRIEVRDGSHDPPRLRHPAPGDGGGRGLLLVNQLARSWGSDDLPSGKLVWFEVAS